MFYCIFRKKAKRRRRWSSRFWLVHLKSRAKNPLACLFYILLIVVYLIYKETKWLSGRHKHWQTTGPGFEPQVPHYFHVIFHAMFPCSFSLKEHPMSIQSGHPRAYGDGSNGHNLKRTMDCSQPPHTLVSKSTRLKELGPKLLGFTSKIRGLTPLGFAIFFTFFVFIIFIFF